MEQVTTSVRLDTETVTFLDELAQSEDRDRSYLIRQAIASYVELRRWQIEEIRKAIKEADAGLFLSDEEAAAFMEELAK
jgi:RHH-type transcriptional regulator, rel operon repressor / antitoxin RelB